MWKAAFTGRSEGGGGGSSSGRPSEPRRKRSHRAESVTSSRPRDDDDRRRSSRAGSVYDGEDSVYGVPSSAMSSGVAGHGSSPYTAPLTASALRMLPDDEEAWEDEDRDARSERKSRRSEGERRHKSGGKEREREKEKGREKEREREKAKERSRSHSREKERKKASSKSSGKEKERDREKEKDKARESQSERERDSKRRPQLVESPERESSRAMPEMGSFAQFPGQYTGGHMGPLSPHQQDAIMSGALPNSAPQQGQFPGQDSYHDPTPSRPPLGQPTHSWGAAADYYLDTGESVQHQPGVRINSPNMLVNPDQHLVAASAQPVPAVDTGNGAANDFYSGNVHGAGVSASAPVTPASKPKPKPAKQSSWSALKPGKTASKPGKVEKPAKTSSSNTAAAAMAAAAGVGVLGAASHAHSSSSQGQSSSSTSKPNRRDSDGNVYYGPPPQPQPSSYTYGVPGTSTAQGSVNAYGAQSTNGTSNYTNAYSTAHSTSGKHSSNSNSNVPLYAAGAAAAGMAAYGINQHHQQSSHNMTSSGSYGGGGQGPPQPPRPGMGGFSHYPSSGGGGTGMHQLHHQHEHKGPMTRLKDGLFNLISTPEDTAKMEMYTEYIGVCKHCFDPRTSPWDAPRQHHYHKSKRRDSFEELRRRRSNERLGRKGSNDSLRRAGSVRVDKDNRYYASDSSRKRRETGKSTGILGAGLAAAGVATAANAIFGDSRKDFDDTYSVKSGHRERSAARRRSRSSSREQRRKSTHGVLRPSDREEFVTVRKKDGTIERRRVRKQSRSSSRESRSNGFFGAAAGAALGAGAASAGMRRRSRSRSRDSKGRRSQRREEEPASQGIFSFFSPPKKGKDSRKKQSKSSKGFFTFSNSSSSSSNSELAFGEGFSSRTSLPLRRKSSGRSSTKRSRRTSDDHLAATVAGIGATAAALAAAQKGGRINKRPSKVELGARKDVHRRGRAHASGSSGSSNDDEWEDELPSDVDDNSSMDGGLAFGDYGSRRVPSRQSLESINSQSSAGGLGAWGWRWGGKDKKRQSRNSTSPRPSYAPSTSDAANGYHADVSRPYSSGQAVYLDDTGRRLPSTTSTSSPSVPTQPLQVVDPQPIFDSGMTTPRHNSMPGAFGPDSPPIYRPGPAPLQQPQPTTPIKPAFTQNTSGLEDSNWARNSGSNNFAQDAALIGAGALATAGIIAATSSNNSAGKKSRDSMGSNVRFGLTEDQQRKEDRERRREDKQADEERRRADRTRALKEEAERSTRESEARKAEAAARESRQEDIRRAREDDNRRAAEAKLAAARREAEEQAQLDRERQAEHQRSMREREENYRREQARLAEEARQQEERREADERERYLRQQQEGERRAKERNDGERKSSKSGLARGKSVSEQSEKKQSSAWAPVAGAAAAATVGAVIAGRDTRDRKVHDEPQTASNQQEQPYQATEVTPHSSRDGKPLMDDELFDPDFFKRKHTPAERARYEELARKAAEKVVSADQVSSDREHAYDDHSTYAEFFAPKDVLSEPAEGKTKVLGPNADNDIQVYHARDANILAHLDGARYGSTRGQSKHAPFGVPKLNLISPTPPITESSPVRTKASNNSSPSSPLSKSAKTVEDDIADPDTDSDSKSDKLNRSISWGEDKTHVYDVQTPESYNEKERDSYIMSPDVEAATRDATSSGEKTKGIVVEETSPSGQSKTTTYSEDELAKHYRESSQRGYDNGTSSAPQQPFYRQPFVDSVSDFSIRLPTPGTEDAPPVRGYVEGETNEPTPAEEKARRIPGGFDDDVYESYTQPTNVTSASNKEEDATSAGASRDDKAVDEPAWEPPLSKKDKKKREKAIKQAEAEPVVEEPAAWEPPLSKKEQKKRDKAAKKSSTVDTEPATATPTAAEPEAESEAIKDQVTLTESPTAAQSVEEPAWEPPLSKKEQKKRDKAKKQEFADSTESPPRDVQKPELPDVQDREASSAPQEEPALTKKEQRKQDKQAKKSGYGGFADVADTILASGGIAAAAGALDSAEDDGFSSAGKKKGKKGKKAKLGEPLDRDIRETEPESQENGAPTMPGGWEVDQESPGSKDKKSDAQTAFDPFQYQVLEDGANTPPAAPEPPPAQEVDPWAEFAEPKKSKKKSKRNSAAFNVPEVSSPLRTELAWDDYVGRDKTNADETGNKVDEETSRANGHSQDKDSGSTRSERTPGQPASTSSERRGSDYFGNTRQDTRESSRRTSPDDSRSVASAPTASRRDDGRPGSDYFDEPSYAYETQSVAASEPVDLYGSSKKSKRRSRHEDDEPRRSRRDDDDDTRSVISTRSRRDKEESPSVKKDKKSGILGSLFGRKSESSRDPPRDSKSSRDDEDDEARRRRKKKNRESDLLDEDDDTRSVKSESRHRSHRSRSEYGDDDDDTRSVRSEARHKSRRSEVGADDSRERRRRSTHDSDFDRDVTDSGKKHHHRRKSGEDSRSSSRHGSRSESGHHSSRSRKIDEDTKDQSFLGMRVEDLPPLPANVPAQSSSVAIAKGEQEVGAPAQAGQDARMVKNDDGEIVIPDTPFASTETLSTRPGSSHRAASSTAIPLRFPFGHAPLTPTLGSTKERSSSFSSSTAPTSISTPSSPVSTRKSRQDRPRSTEIKPLYLVERNRKTAEVEDALPSLPSSGPSSRASSAHLSDAYESALEEMESPGVDKENKLRLDTDGAQKWREENGDVLGSKETTPKASEILQQPFFPAGAERQVKQQPQFYTWEDFAREERGRETDEDLPPLPLSRSESPAKADQHEQLRDGIKVAAAGAVLGTAAVYAAGELRRKSPERGVDVGRDIMQPAPTAASDTTSKSEAPLSRKSSMKKKGKKGKKLQWQDEEEAAVAQDETASKKVGGVEPDTISQQLEPNTVFASSAAHTMPVYERQERSDPLHDNKQQNLELSSDDARGLDGSAAPDEQEVPKEQLEHEGERPPTSYEIPTAKAEPAPLVVEERVVAAGLDDAPSSAAEIQEAPQLTRKQSKKSKKKQQSVSLFEHEREHEQKQEQIPAHDNVQPDETRDAPPPQINFGLSDFSNFAQESGTGWHDSQAEAFQSAMASTSQSTPEVTSSRDLGVEQMRTDNQADALAEVGMAEANPEDEFPSVASKKQSKKDKKNKRQKESSWSEEPKEAELGSVDVLETPRELVDEPNVPVEEFVPSSSKKSKKDKKKNLAAWDDVETPNEPISLPEQVTIPEDDGGDPSQRENETASAPAIEEPLLPASSSKKSKKDKKKKSLAWDEPDAQESPNLAAPVEQTEPLVDETTREAEQNSTPATEEPMFTSSSKKKSKKDKKKSSSWDEPDALEDTTPSKETHVQMEEDQSIAQVPDTSTTTNEDPGSQFQAEAEWGLAPKKGKKSKKNRQSMAWSDSLAETAPSKDDNDASFVDAEEGNGPSGLHSAEERTVSEESAADAAVVAAATSVAAAAAVAGLTRSAEDVPEPAADDFAPISTKKSKKDKKKSRQSQTWEPEEQQASSEPIVEDSTGRADEAAAVDESSQPAQERSVPADASVEDTSGLSRKQSKKDKKKSRQASAWDIESDMNAPEGQQVSGAAAETASEAQSMSVPLSPGKTDSPENIPIPPEASDDLLDADQLGGESQTVSNDLEDQSASALDSHPPINADEAGAKLNEMESENNDDIGTWETDDFFGPAEPVMVEPSRMTEDLDAFGELDARAVEREERRAAREAAESARIAESMRERPKDENYASMLTDRKPAPKKNAKKGRKSISSVTTPSPAVIEESSTAGEAAPESEDITKPDESFPSTEIDSIDAAAPAPEEPEDEDIWTSSSKKKGKKGKRDRNSIAEVPTTVEQPAEALDESTIQEQPLARADDVASEQKVDKDAQPEDAPQDGDEDNWASGSKKDKKKKKGKESVSDTIPSVIETAPGQQSLTEEGDVTASKDVETSIDPADTTPRDVEPSPAADHSIASVAEDEDFGWASSSKKKGKKGKKNRPSLEAAPALDDEKAKDESTIPPSEDPVPNEAPTAEPSLTIDESAAQAPDPGDEFAWTSSSKKKGKKGKKSQSVAEVVSIPEDSITIQPKSVADDREKDVVADSTQIVEKPSTTEETEIEAQADPNKEFEDFSWASSSKKKNKKGKKDRSSPFEMPSADVNEPVNEPVETSAFEDATPVAAQAPGEISASASEDVASAQNVTSVDPIDEESAWALPSSKKKSKKGKKSRSGSITPMTESAPLEAQTDMPSSSDAPATGASDNEPQAAHSAHDDETLSAAANEDPQSQDLQQPGVEQSTISRDVGDTSEATSPPDESTAEFKPSTEAPETAVATGEVDVEGANLPAETGTEDPSQEDTSWFAPQTGKKKKGKQGKKAKHIEDEPDRDLPTEVEQPIAPDADLDVPSALDSNHAGEVDVWTPPSKDKKGKKGKKGKWQEFDDSEPNPETAKDEGSADLPSLESQEPTMAAPEDIWTPPAKGKKAKKNKKNMQSWTETVPQTTEAGSLDAVEAPVSDHSPLQHEEANQDSQLDPKHEAFEQGKTNEATAIPDPEAGEGDRPADVSQPLQDSNDVSTEQSTGDQDAFVVKASKKDKKKGKKSRASTSDPWAENEPAEGARTAEAASDPIEDNQARSLDVGGTAAAASAVVAGAIVADAIKTEPEEEWGGFSTKQSKKDKKKSKKNGSAIQDDEGHEKVELAPDSFDPTNDNISKGGEAQPEVQVEPLPESVPVVGTEPVVEDEWANFSTKKSKKDKKKAKRSGSSTPAAANDDKVAEPTDIVPTETVPADVTKDSEEISEPVAKTQSASADVEPLEDEWASFSTKKSKKDKKKAKQSESPMQPVVENKEVAEPVEAEPVPVVDDLENVADEVPVLNTEAEGAVANAESVEDEWASFSTKKSKKDKKKAKQSEPSMQPVAKEHEAAEPVEAMSVPAVAELEGVPDEVSGLNTEAEGAVANAEPAEEEWASFPTKKSKKDKKKGKKTETLTSAGTEDTETAEQVEPVSEPVATAEEETAKEMADENDVSTPNAPMEDPEADTWTSPASTKKTKKDKKKAKKSGLSTPAVELDNEPSSIAGESPRNLEAESSTNEVQATPPAEESAAVDASEAFEAATGLKEDSPTLGNDVGEATQIPQGTNTSPPASDAARDIDFAATLAAGLADSGFNPDMVINDPVFHRRASPPGSLPEADPEEIFSTTTSKRKKGKKSKAQGSNDINDKNDATLDAPTATQDQPADDFNATISQSLQGTGFDPSLLEKALASSNDDSAGKALDDQPEFSFATSKRKKDKKSKKQSVGEEESAVEPIPSEAQDIRTLPTVDEPKKQEVQDTVGGSKDDTLPTELNESTRDLDDPANRLAMGDGEMDADEMDKAYKAYKKNKRKQRKLKSSTKTDGSSDNPESAMDTGKSAAASDSENRSRDIAAEAPGSSGIDLTAAGAAALAAGSLMLGEGKSQSASQPPALSEPGWSFASLEGADQGASRSLPRDIKEHETIRDSGYEEANRSRNQSERSSREVPDIVRTSSSQESLRNRRSLEPLRISTGSTPDEEWSAKTPAKQTETTNKTNSHAHARTASTDTPLLPTSKNRTSYLFQSPPDNLAAPVDSSQQQPFDPRASNTKSESSDYFKSKAASDGRDSMANSHGDSIVDSDTNRDRSSFSPASAAGPLSPRTPLRSIAEESQPVKRSKPDTDVGSSGQIKVSKRGETPKGTQSSRSRHRTLSPEIRVPEAMSLGSGRATSNPLSTDDIIKRLSWPAVDEENDTVNIDRSVSRKAIMPDMRSPSVMSNRSATSGTYGRSAQDLRSFSRNSNASNSSTPSLRRINLSGDLRAASRRGETGSSVSGSAPNTIPFEAPPTPPLNDDELNLGSASRAANMSDVFQGYGDAAESHVSPTRPPSVRKRQSMHINELESRLDSLVAENRALQEARQSQDSSRYVVNDQNLVETLQQRELDLQAKDAEINQIKAMLQPMQEEIARLSEMNNGLTEANRNLVDDTNGRYATLQAEHAQAQEQWQATTRNLENMQREHGRVTSGMKDILEAEIATALADKNAEILRLREQLDIATEQIRALQVQIQSSSSSDFLVQRDEDYFDGSCQKLCQHVQQWVLRFSKLSDNRVCRLSTELNDDKLEARLDNAVLDGSDVDKLLGDRIRRRDVFMSVVMTMVWEYIFTRYLFGMDREQRQKLKALEKLLSDVGPPRAVAHWRATTLTLLSKRPNFSNQCAMDTEAVAIEIFGFLSSLLPPPSASEQQLLASLQKVIRIAVDLSIEMRIQRAEYIMLPPLQPEYDTNGDLVRKVHFNASLMNERSGFFSSNEELAAEHAVVKIVLFPLVVKKGDDIGEGEEEIVVCPAQVLVRNDAGKGKKVVRVMSGAMEIDDPIRSRSRLSSKPSMMSEGGAF